MIVWWRVIYAAELPRSWDQVDFTLALDRFDLFAMQPHFPGYPYFILGGMLVNKWILNPVQALAIWNGILMLLSIYPVYMISRSVLSRTLSIAIVAVIQSMVFINVMTVQPMSETAAVAILWWYIWSLQKAFLNKQSKNSVILSSLLFSLVLGVRLSYLPFGVGLLILLIQRRKQFKTTKAYGSFLAIQVGIASLFQLVWIAGLASSEGGVAAFLQLAFGFSEGHFEEWGGTAATATAPILERISNLTLDNIIWTGMGGQEILVLIPVIILLLYMTVRRIMSDRKSQRTNSWFKWAYVAMIISYFLWALLAQNIDKPRHILPLPGMVVLGVICSGVTSQSEHSKRIILALAILIGVQTSFSYHVLKESRAPASVYQLIDYLEEINEPLIVYTWEETRVMEYNEVTFDHEQIYTYTTFLSDLQYYEKKRVFLTEQVVKGFEKQGVPIWDNVKRMTEFHSSPLYDPVYDEIVLYEFVR